MNAITRRLTIASIAALLISSALLLDTHALKHHVWWHTPKPVTYVQLPHRDKAESFDQENLKKSDQGCPTAIYVAPLGQLTQCQLIDDAHPAVPGDKVRVFATQDEAAIYVLSKVYEKSHYYEYGGEILKGPLGYYVALPTTQHHGMDVSFDQDPESYDFPIAASYHVHPCLKDAYPAVFSPQDLSSSRATHTPGYVLDECTGDVHYWAPGDGYMSGDELIRLGINPLMAAMGVQLSLGKVIGHLPVDHIQIN
jgi:hypothetical protein